MSDKTPSNRRNSNLKRGKTISPGAVNPRQSNAPVSMQVGEKVFQTWNQDTRYQYFNIKIRFDLFFCSINICLINHGVSKNIAWILSCR